MKKFLLIIILAAAAVGITYVVKPHQSLAPAVTENQSPTQPVISSNYVKYAGQDGKNALELLQAITPVDVKEFSFGVMVEAINHVKPDSKHFWKLYANGKEAEVGAGSLATHNGDFLEWKLEEIKNNY